MHTLRREEGEQQKSPNFNLMDIDNKGRSSAATPGGGRRLIVLAMAGNSLPLQVVGHDHRLDAGGEGHGGRSTAHDRARRNEPTDILATGHAHPSGLHMSEPGLCDWLC